MPNYQNGKIYKIWSPHTYLIYIGSTTQSLPKRFADHKIEYNAWAKNKEFLWGTNSKKIFECGDARIELLELVPCTCREELMRAEGRHIRNCGTVCVNWSVPLLSQEERTEKYLQRAERVSCECGTVVRQNNLNQHRKSKKHSNLMAEKGIIILQEGSVHPMHNK